MEIAIIGAGPSGLATAAVLQGFGHTVTVFEQSPDVGGVWSADRRYPGVATQDDRISYAFSDVPMPEDHPEHPGGDQVRAYLQHYARVKGIEDRVLLSTRVERAVPDAERGGWRIETGGVHGPRTHLADWLVVANGVYSTPHVPDWTGRKEFEASGGRVVVPTSLGDGEALVGGRVVVVGWGKTACDVAAAASRTALETTVVVRQVRWKMPRHLGAGLTFRHLLLTRFGEHLMAPGRTTACERLVAVLGAPARRATTWCLARAVVRRTGLREVGLVPDLPLQHCDSLVTDGFFEAVAQSRIDVRRECTVRALGADGGVPGVHLSDGTWVAADVVVPATGFEQEIDFLDPAVRARLLGEDAVVRLDRRILPLGVPGLAFAGWGNTYRSPLTAEIGAVWLAGHLAGALRVRPSDQVRRTADRYHLTHRQAAARGEPQLPSGSFAALDALLDDLQLPLAGRVRRRQWTRPLRPADYADLAPRLQARLGTVGTDGEGGPQAGAAERRWPAMRPSPVPTGER